MFDDPTPSSERALDPAVLFDGAPEALLVIEAGVVVRANEQARALFGVDPRGERIDLLVRGWRRDVGEPFDAEVDTTGAEPLPVEVRVTETDARAIVAIRDAREVIAGREAVRQLFEVETRYRSLVEQVPAVVYEDRGDLTIYVSPQIEQILGVTAEAYIADPGMWMRMVHPDDRAWVKEQSDAFLEGSGGDLDDYRMVRPDGRVVWIRDRAFAYRGDDGRVILEQGLLFDVTELKEAEARVTHMAYHDALTGLANRELFHESLHLAVERARRDATSIAVLYLDLDNFKQLNDTEGHHVGDRLLARLGERLAASTRDVDVVARQGGDEFLLMLADLAVGDGDVVVERVLSRVLAALSEPIDVGAGTPFVVHGSIGVSRFPQDAGDAETLMRHADAAMYRAKRSGPGGYRFYLDDA
jgi:diguanylate cyclase (GGDEF)-like protein/PAS domain S-box-containing protein